MKTHTTLIALLLATLGTLLSTSCSTFRGFGRDVQHVGNHIEHAARH